jgi:hypothetical protein
MWAMRPQGECLNTVCDRPRLSRQAITQAITTFSAEVRNSMKSSTTGNPNLDITGNGSMKRSRDHRVYIPISKRSQGWERKTKSRRSSAKGVSLKACISMANRGVWGSIRYNGRSKKCTSTTAWNKRRLHLMTGDDTLSICVDARTRSYTQKYPYIYAYISCSSVRYRDARPPFFVHA